MKKRLLVCILMALVMVFSAPATLTFAEGDDSGQQTEIQTLATPSNLIWKDESTATAGWDAVEGANYYVVNVYVSVNGSEVGTTETGTAATEVDLQHEINAVLEGSNADVIDVEFDVKAQYISDDTTIEGAVSSRSSALTITTEGRPQLETPEDVTLSNDYVLSWSNYDFRGFAYYVGAQVSYNGKTHTDSFITYWGNHEISTSNGRATVGSSKVIDVLKTAYANAGYSGETVNVRLIINAQAPVASEYKNGEKAYSNYVEYSWDGKTQLETPEDVTLSNDYVLSWSNYDFRGFAYYVGAQVSYNGKTHTDSFITYWGNHEISTSNGRATVGSSKVIDVLKTAYANAGYSGETVNVRLIINAQAPTTGDYTTGAKAYSNYVEYSWTGKTPLETPENVVLSDAHELSWDNYDSRGFAYTVGTQVVYNGRTKTDNFLKWVYKSDMTISNGHAKIGSNKLEEMLRSAYEEAGYSNETVQIRLMINADAATTGDYSDGAKAYSNYIYYNPAGSTVINEIALSPEHPVIAVGRTLYIGKIISPANAYYSKVNWSSDDNSTAPIDANGKVTGAKKGNANITAQINNATKTIPVSVYEIASNVDDSEQSTEVMDTAKDAIDSLIVDGDATGTDINDVDAACEEIVQAAQNGDQFNVDLNIEEKEKNELDASWSDIQDVVGDKEFAAAYDVTVGISHTDSEGASHLIGNLTAFDSEVGFELEKPDDLPAVTENCNREFYLARIHEGNIEEIQLTETNEGNYAAASNVFSDFVLLYKDVPCDHDYKNPVFNWSEDGKTCTVTYTCSVNADHKATYDCEVTSKVKEAATCSKKGTTTYTATYNDISDTKDVVDIDYDMSAHDYQNPVFNWSDDGKTCTVTYTCTRNADHKATYDCEVTSKVKEAATCAKKGTTTYTATYNDISDTKDVVDIDYDMSTHDYQNPVFNWSDDGKICTITYTCTRDSDHKATYDCEVTSKVKEAATCSKKGTTTYTATYKGLSDTKDVVDIEIVPSAHVFGDSYTVDEPATCAKEGRESIHCSECGAIKEGSERVIEKTTDHKYGAWNTTKEATCTEDGSKEKICSVCNDKVIEVIPATDHDWKAPTYSWTTDYKSVTATRVCKNDPSHVETETVNTTSAVTKKPTYTAKGQTTYTATFSNAAFSTQTKTVTNIAQLPKKANTITVKVKKPTVKYAKLKKKAQTILVKNAFVVSKAQGKVTYKRVSGNKKITINSAGKITLKKGLKKGTYKVRVKVTAAGTTAYKAGAKTVTLSIKVK